MIIEFIGSTGAGKTTLIQRILSTCEREGIAAVAGTDAVLKQCGLNWVHHHLVRAALVNLIALAASLAAWRSYPDFYRFTFHTLLKLPDTVPWFHRLWLAKNILKRIGIYELVRRHDDPQHLVLIDEGTLHVAHSLFVHLDGAPDGQALSTFARLAPLPQVVVYLRQDEATLAERLLARRHPRVPDGSLADATHFVRQAVGVFDELVQHPAIAQRVIVVDGAQKRVTVPGSGRDPLPARAAKLVQAGLHVSAEEVTV